MMHGKWEVQTGKYQSGENYRIGKIVVGSAFYSGNTSKGDPLKYAVSIKLPGIKNPEERYPTMDEAKTRLERAVSVWFSWLDQEQ